MDSYFELFIKSFPLLMKGTWMTIKVLIFAALLSNLCGLFFGFFSCNRIKIPIFSWLIEALCFVLRAVPFYVQLLIVYFVLPDLCGFSLEPFPAAVFSLGICSSGYVAQIIRGGINAIPESHWEAAFILGYTKWQSFRYAILPQVLRNVLPSLSNELDALLKSTAVVSSIGMLELTRVGMNIVSREMQPVAIYLTIAFFYLCISSFLNLFTRTIEKRIRYA